MVAEENGLYQLAYYDVEERRLARAELTLSRRLENGKGIWRLELPRPDGERVLVEEPGGPASPPAPIRRLLPAFLRGQKPTPVARLRVHRENGAERVEVLAGELSPDGDEPAREPIGFIRALLGRQYEEILRHDPGVRLDLDPEDVHRLRVAARRARAVLRAARPVLDPEWSEPLRAELKWLGGSLGPLRDLDVLLARLHGEIAELDQPEHTAAAALVDALESEREGAQAQAAEVLGSDRYLHLLDALEAAARGPRVRRGKVSLGKLAAKEFKRLRKEAERLGPESTDDELHRVRILGKRARYAAELAEPEAGKSARRVVARAKSFQDVLGAHQDAIVAEARLRGLLADQPRSGAAFAAGRLVEGERRRKLQARTELPQAWSKLDRAAQRAWG
jgi:CHAD domain-containing protein